MSIVVWFSLIYLYKSIINKQAIQGFFNIYFYFCITLNSNNMKLFFNFNKITQRLVSPKHTKGTVRSYIYWIMTSNERAKFADTEFRQRLYNETEKKCKEDLQALKKHLGL